MEAEFNGRKVETLGGYGRRLRELFETYRDEGLEEEGFQEDTGEEAKYLLVFDSDQLTGLIQYKLPEDGSDIGEIKNIWKHPDHRDGRRYDIVYFLLKAEGLHGVAASTPREELADEMAEEGGKTMRWKKTGEKEVYIDVDRIPEEDKKNVPV